MRRNNLYLALLCLGCAGCGVAHGQIFHRPPAKSTPESHAAVTAPAAPAATVNEPDPAAEAMRMRGASQRQQQHAQAAPPPTPYYTPPPDTPEARYLEIPAIVEGSIDEWIVIKPKTNYPVVKYISADRGLKVFPSSELTNKMNTVVEARTPGDYRMAAIAAEGDEPTDPLWFIVRVGQAPQPPPGPGPTPPPGPNPPPPNPGPNPPPPDPKPPVTAANLWIITIDNVLQRTQAAATVLNDTTLWNRSDPPRAGSFLAQGHQFKQYNTTSPEAVQFQKMVDATPAGPDNRRRTVILLDAKTRVWLNTAPADLALPATPAAMQALVNKYTTGK